MKKALWTIAFVVASCVPALAGEIENPGRTLPTLKQIVMVWFSMMF